MTSTSLDEVLTARMRLVRVTADDGADLLNMHNNPRVSPTLGGPATEEEGRIRLARHLEHWERHGWGYWIARDRETNAFIGRGGLRQQLIDGRDEIELGYGFAPEAWGRGLATELAREAVRIAFRVLQLPDLICFTLPTNRASQRVMEKVGFIYERDGIWAGLPHVFYRLTAYGLPPRTSSSFRTS
jgi:ribosomal-protein-alanine N-acetyltransferase